MAVPHNQQELLEAIRSTYQKLAVELASVPAGKAREATLEGHVQGTQMSVADLVAYLIGWNTQVLRWCDGKAKGLQVDFPAIGYQWNELGRLAQQFYADHADQGYAELLAQLAVVHERIVVLVAQESDATLYGVPWYGKHTQGRMIQLNTASPYANARARLRKWKRVHGLA